MIADGDLDIANGKIISSRQAVRRRVSADVVIRSSRQGRIGGQVLDISEYGCKLDISGCVVEAGQQLTIKLSNMESWSGLVRWTDGQIVGVQFDSPLHSAVVDHLAKINLLVGSK